jgi:hypothetical protein
MKEVFTSKVDQKRYCEKIKLLKSTVAQKKAFDLIRQIIEEKEVLTHLDYDREFIFYVDAFRE